MNEDPSIREMANAYALAHARGTAHRTPAPHRLPTDMGQAYAVQRALVDLWSAGPRGPVGGYKIALTSKAMQEMVGVDTPCGGTIFAGDIHRAPVSLSLSRFQHVGLEFELCFELARDLPAADAPYTASDVVDAVASAVPAFELVEDRNASYADLDARDLVAENAWCAGIVLGTADADWRELDLANTPVELDYTGEVERANTSAAMGNPLNALAWVANHQAAQGRPVQAGHVVMTGSCMKTRFPVPGDSALYSVSGLGSVSVRFET